MLKSPPPPSHSPTNNYITLIFMLRRLGILGPQMSPCLGTQDTPHREQFTWLIIRSSVIELSHLYSVLFTRVLKNSIFGVDYAQSLVGFLFKIQKKPVKPVLDQNEAFLFSCHRLVNLHMTYKHKLFFTFA